MEARMLIVREVDHFFNFWKILKSISHPSSFWIGTFFRSRHMNGPVSSATSAWLPVTAASPSMSSAKSRVLWTSSPSMAMGTLFWLCPALWSYEYRSVYKISKKPMGSLYFLVPSIYVSFWCLWSNWSRPVTPPSVRAASAFLVVLYNDYIKSTDETITFQDFSCKLGFTMTWRCFHEFLFKFLP